MEENRQKAFNDNLYDVFVHIFVKGDPIVQSKMQICNALNVAILIILNYPASCLYLHLKHTLVTH